MVIFFIVAGIWSVGCIVMFLLYIFARPTYDHIPTMEYRYYR